MLFSSEVQTAPWSYGNPVYTAPDRHWGYHSMFGEYDVPIGIGTRKFPRFRFRELTEPEFWAAVNALDQRYRSGW